jgi:ribosome-binding protein aMBF1 (putative translation factor)
MDILSIVKDKSSVALQDQNAYHFPVGRGRPPLAAREVKRDFADRLTKFREAHGLERADLAALLDIPTDTYRKYEEGRNEPSLWVLAKLHSVLNCSLDYLVSGNRPITILPFKRHGGG